MKAAWFPGGRLRRTAASFLPFALAVLRGALVPGVRDRLGSLRPVWRLVPPRGRSRDLLLRVRDCNLWVRRGASAFPRPLLTLEVFALSQQFRRAKFFGTRARQ